MKTPNILLILLCCPVLLFAQETVTVKTKPKRWDWYYEEYQVLKSDRKIFHGPYKRFTKDENKIVEEGNYKNGKKDGLWIEYTSNGKFITKGNYTDDTPTGQWEFYDSKGNLEQRYDYTTRTFLFSKPGANIPRDTVLTVYNGDDGKEMKVDVPPIMLGGPYHWQRFLNKNLRYPQDAIDKNKMGVVVVGFIINTDGNASDFSIERGAFKSLDEEALRVVKLVANKWIPAMVNGKPVKAAFSQAIVF
ncbi:MAG TPA: TonB family protein, partial [Chitinophagaceae bacterium]